MTLPIWDNVLYMPGDIIAAWILMVLLGPILALWLFKTKKWPIVWEYMRTTNHRKIGTMYVLFGFLFFLRGGVDALLMRTQLAVPENNFWLFQGEKYNEVFSTHGTMMIFFAAMPLLIGLMNIAVPLQIGARDLAFPFLNAVSFWMFLAGGMLFNMAFFLDSSPNAGWTAYTPLSTDTYTQTAGNDYYTFALQISGLGTTLTAINMIVTILRHRAPGMKLNRMPLFPWATLVTSFLILVAFPVLTIALFLLMFDRLFDTSFFSGEAGNPVYWQHLFWIFGHPEVYILALPAFGIFSDVISTFSRKKVFGYTAMVLSLCLIGFLGFMVWAHHMFTVGLGPMANIFFAITTMMIAIPTGIKVFNWLFTMRNGVVRFTVPMLFALAFIPTFVMGGVTGVMLSVAAADMQFHDTHFVVAHFHYTIIGSTILGVFAGIYYWYPKITGKLLDRRLGLWHLGLFITGFHLTFFIMHITGLNGMPRRTYTYQWGENLFVFNFISTIGAFLMGAGMAVFVWNILRTWRSGNHAEADPWQGRTLEWTVPSPSPEHPFTQIPVVDQRDAFWYAKQEERHLSIEKQARPAPIALKTLQPLCIGVILWLLSLAMIYHWWMLAALSGVLVLAMFLLRTWRDERIKAIGKEEVTDE
ncbi:cytochrome ubiquinol oxidase subunit I [Sediminibacillus dalangtanensis]|uniref:Cytochrome ubiquinol oxidase subunit I n=1 Tax=Sediminibacillus dalangtanensis TaxID=2729421 RepID=A0ABX7VW84_9BACI|nr:cbb3-type cytochrome c oxidase subunit I [Sediminibacillus dalangtanensis]QTN00922.1 cytochrome ubiquinol oxidase subunit I [Sediminibacillus dalangtanensis]